MLFRSAAAPLAYLAGRHLGAITIAPAAPVSCLIVSTLYAVALLALTRLNRAVA